MQLRPFCVLYCLLLSGCAGQTTQEVVLNPQPNRCQVTEVRPTMFSTLTIGICWGENGQVLGLTSADGQPGVSVPLSVLGVGTALGSAYLLGSQIVNAAKSIPREINGNITVDPVQVDINADLDVTP